jgi:hypothetical protein
MKRNNFILFPIFLILYFLIMIIFISFFLLKLFNELRHKITNRIRIQSTDSQFYMKGFSSINFEDII